MRKDKIIEIGIDKSDRLYLKPETEKFTLIHRSAAEVHWDNKGLFLYSPKPRDWSYLDWYKYITSLIKSDCDCQLTLTEKTVWVNIDDNLKNDIKMTEQKTTP